MYSCIKNTLIIHPEFNDELKGKMRTDMKKHERLIFANYKNKKKYEDKYIKPKKYSNDNAQLKHIQQFPYSKSQYMCSKFNNEIDNTLPENIKYLQLGYSFNHTVDNLGSGLEHIVFGYEFNQRVDNLPFTIKSLIFGYSFNQTVDNIPCSIVRLELSYSFNQKIDDLPIGLEILVIGKNFSHNINCLPSTLVHLEIKSKYYNDDHYNKKVLNICALPKNLKEIDFIDKNRYNRYGGTKIEKYDIHNIKYKFGKKNIDFF